MILQFYSRIKLPKNSLKQINWQQNILYENIFSTSLKCILVVALSPDLPVMTKTHNLFSIIFKKKEHI